MEKLYDLIVAGGGGAGLCAAWSAMENGAKDVLILEAGKKTGGNSAAAGAFMYALETPQLAGSGKNTIQQELREALTFHHFEFINPRLLRAWFEETSRSLAWIESRGRSFTLSPMGEGYTHLLDGSPGVGWFHTFLTPLSKELEERGAEIRTRTRVTQMLTENGRVVGVRAEDAQGETEYRAKAVLLSVGGFLQRTDLLEKYFPAYFNPDAYWSVVPSDGRGGEMAAQAGAQVKPECTLLKESGLAFGTMKPGLPGRLFSLPGTVMINARGRRYVDESLWNQNYAANAMLNQPGKIGYALYSQGSLAHAMSGGGAGGAGSEDGGDLTALKAEAAKRELCIFADTLDEVAQWIGADPAVLAKTVADYNGYCAIGEDRELAKPADQLIPLDCGPWLCVKVFPMYIDTIGPVCVDEALHVLDENDRPIPGFYAAGVLAAGWQGRDYMRFGSALSFAVSSGRIAGRTIAAELQ